MNDELRDNGDVDQSPNSPGVTMLVRMERLTVMLGQCITAVQELQTDLKGHKTQVDAKIEALRVEIEATKSQMRSWGVAVAALMGAFQIASALGLFRKQ